MDAKRARFEPVSQPYCRIRVADKLHALQFVAAVGKPLRAVAVVGSTCDRDSGRQERMD